MKSVKDRRLVEGLEVSVINECKMEGLQEVGIRMKQRMHVSIFRLENWREYIQTKSRCSTVKERRRMIS